MLAAFWVAAGGSLGTYGLNAPATGLVFLAAMLVLPSALYFRSDGNVGTLEPTNPWRARLPWVLWGFAVLVVVSALSMRTYAAVQNGAVYLSFVALLAIAAAWTSAGSPMLVLRAVRAVAVVLALVYLASVLVYGPGNYVVIPARLLGESVWIGMVAAVPLTDRKSRWGYAVPLVLLAADVFSLSRTSSAVCALLFLGLVAKGRSRKELGKVLAVSAVVGCSAWLVITRYEPLRNRFIDNDGASMAGVRVGTSGRSDLWATTWESIQTSPWIGHGIGSAGNLLADPANPADLGHPHNDYLRLWHDLGLLGLALWLAAFAALGIGAYRRRRHAANQADWAIHQAALLALIGLSLNILTSNLLVYAFVMVPIAVIVGTSMGRADIRDEAPARPRTPRDPRTGTGQSPGRRRLDPRKHTVDLRCYFRALARRWLTILLMTSAGLGCAVAATLAATPQYQATAQIFVSARTTTDITQLNQGSSFSLARVESYADVVSSPRVAAAVVDALGLPLSPEYVAQRIGARAKPDTVLIDITVTDPDPVLAARIANAAAAEAGKFIVGLETTPGRGSAPVHIGVTRSASPPAEPVSPRPYLNAALGLFAGLLAGICLAMVRHNLDTSVRTEDELKGATALPVLGVIPFDKRAQADPLAVRPGALSGRAEAFRLVRTNLRFAQVDRQQQVIVVTSALPGEGKTNTAVNLALSLAEAGQRVCLVDADLRNPCVAKTLGLVQSAGLTTLLIGHAERDDVLQRGTDDNLVVLTSGPIPPNPAEILASMRMRQILEDLGRDFDIVIVDSAPLLPVADTLGLAPIVDGAILVVRAGRTRADSVEAAIGALRGVSASILGTVLSMAQLSGARGYGYGYGNPGAREAASDRPKPPLPRSVHSDASESSSSRRA
ncbi:polysaccharide biosynthesis tyrosine autokinase [Yinghuangia soli]|uniref:non-specific protein-tyrosine kinase n=1 Tax=Yinghuangia soli TaxID=2908204 RepID=A0AA41TZZ8_9ACTN|nr:polysaccharide biosynthesis tyrosine autokinase [Yinghuangia soli]MCF2525902.1 polysaccharide biosynthesis tyrosine autokinase [Yinghuangia soli]